MPALRPHFLPLILFFAAIILYAGALQAPFVFDDSPFFDDLARVVREHAYPTADNLRRFLTLASFSWTIYLFGNDIVWLRLGNVMLHGLKIGRASCRERVS
jgi:hypothetical protein